ATGKEIGPLDKHVCAVMGIGFIHDGKELAVGGASGAIRFWETVAGKKYQEPPNEPGSASLYAFTADGKMMAHVSYGGSPLELYDLASDKAPLALLRQSERVLCLAFTADGKLLAAGGKDKSVRVWDAADGKERAVLQHPGVVHGVAF